MIRRSLCSCNIGSFWAFEWKRS